MDNSKNIFLCCFCGILIKSNRSNLTRHEQLHSKNLKRIKCVCCDQTFNNKNNFWSHWEREHGEPILPNQLCCHEYEEPNLKKRVNRATAEIQNGKYVRSTDSYILNTMNSVKNADVKIDLREIIYRCLIQNPFFGQLE